MCMLSGLFAVSKLLAADPGRVCFDILMHLPSVN